MIHRIRDRRTFERLRRRGTRIRRSDLWCTWLPDPDQRATSVAFSIGRALAPAVVRNRMRRRLRAILRELDRSQPLPPGSLLIGVTATAIELTFDQLRTETIELVGAIRAIRPTSSSSSAPSSGRSSPA